MSSAIWCITQGTDGLMYFGTNDGVLEYDGNNWRQIKIPNNSIVRSLCVDSSGQIYVTGSSDFGYLAPDSIGQLVFFSLRPYMKEGEKGFGEVWDVVAVSDGIYFKTLDKIFHWDGNRIKVIGPVYSYRLYVINDEVYARDNERGLVKISGDSTILIPDGGTFAAIGVYDMLPFEDRVHITTSQNGLWLYDGKKCVPFKTEADAFFIKNQIYNTHELADGNFAFATRRGGACIMNKRGQLIQRLNTSSGLISDVVYDIHPDKQGGLWLATNEGISRIEISSPFSILPKENTGRSRINKLYRFHNELYACNDYGIYYLDKSLKKFNSVSGFYSSGLNFVSVHNTLFASSINQISLIDQNHTAYTLFNYTDASLYPSFIDPSIIYAMDRVGITVFRYKNGILRLIKDTLPFTEDLLSIFEDSDGSLWLLTYYEGIIHVQTTATDFFTSGDNDTIVTKLYKNEKDLPGRCRKIFLLAGETHFATDAGLFKFDGLTKTFIPDSILGKSFTDASHVIVFLEKDRSGDLWILAETANDRELGKAVKQQDGTFLWQPDPLLRRVDLTNVLTIYPDYDKEKDKDFLWISSSEGLIQYTAGNRMSYKKDFQTFIRNVYVNQDSLIFGGTADSTAKNSYIFSSKTNHILFQFSAASYDKPQTNRFQYRLEGDNEQWSRWTSEPKKEYTNLSAGDYVFHVRSKNVYGITGRETSFAFTIGLPWYLSWWVFMIYILMFAGILIQIRRWELKRINRKHDLQLKLVEFTKLKELDQLKSQFFANISHEFRTPLTLILGQTESVMSSAVGINEKEKLQVANRNARRLMTLINELLDLSKLEAGSMELKAQPHNIVSFLKSLFWSFESLAEKQKITLKFDSEKENIPVLYDPDKMEKIFYNLLSNALKFTAENGIIEIIIRITESSRVEITVRDSGKGISEDKLPHIFNRFYQADSSITREHEGSGIGLALTKELTELHKGTITAKSKEGLGSSFIISLPLGDETSEKVGAIDASEYSFQETIDSFERDDNGTEEVNTDRQVDPKKEIILIVDDNNDVRIYIKEQLEKEYRVIEAVNGKDGIIQADRYIPDLIISDVMMPEMDGYQFSGGIRRNEKTSHIPIIMLTAKASLDDRIEGLETGVDAYLTKPFSAKELQVRVKNLISQREQLRRRFSKATIIKPSEVSTDSVDQQFLKKTVSFIEAAFEDENFSAGDLAEKVNMSLSQLNRKLNALIDQPAGQLIRSLRLQRAADLLKQNAGTVAEICYTVGFNDQAYFSRAFKKQFQCSPSDFKKKN